jgi:hypothetical protein
MNNNLEKAKTIKPVGTMHPTKPEIWTEYQPGKFDYRGIHTGVGKKTYDEKNNGTLNNNVAPSNNSAPTKSNKSSYSDEVKAKALKYGLNESFIEKLPRLSVSVLKNYAKKSGNGASIRMAAYDELIDRGEDVSDIDINTGKVKKLNQAFGGNKNPDAPAFHLSGGSDGSSTTSSNSDQIPQNPNASIETWNDTIKYFQGESIDYLDSDFVKSVFKDLKTKKSRIQYDKLISDVKRIDPYYLTPDEEIFDLNSSYLQALETRAPFLIASGGAGVGKSYNFKLVAEICNLREYDWDKDAADDNDYEWVEAPNPTSDTQLFELLKKFNGRCIVFDDADGMYSDKSMRDLLKKATNPSGKRTLGRRGESIVFTGQIISITNKSASELTANEDLKAIYSRADKKDIYFTKEEQLYFIESRLHDMNFDALDRLPNQAEDIAEREEVFKLLKDNIDEIDPQKFNSRSLKDAITAKRKAELAVEKVKQKGVLAQRAFGSGGNWKNNLLRDLTKSEKDEFKLEEITFEKALEIFNL